MGNRHWIIFFSAAIMLFGACNIPGGGGVPTEPVPGEEVSDSKDDQGSGLDDQLNPTENEDDEASGTDKPVTSVEFEIASGEWQLRLQVGTITCPNGDIQKLPESDHEEALISLNPNGAAIYFEGFDASEGFELTLLRESEIGVTYAGLGEIDRGEMTFIFNFFKHSNSQDSSSAYNFVIGMIEGELKGCKYSQGFGGGSAGFYQEGVAERITAEGEVMGPESELLTATANTDTPEVGNWQITYLREIKICNKIINPYGPSDPEMIIIDLGSSGEDMFVNGFGISETINLVRQIGPEYYGTLEVEGDITEYILSIAFYPIGDNLARLDGTNGVLRYWENDCFISRNFIGESVD